MDKYSEIAQKIRNISARAAITGGRLPVFLVQVKAVDGDKCTVEYEDTEFSDVRLRSVINDETSKILITPKADSYILVTDLFGDLTELTVLQYSEIDKIEINCDSIILNNGDNNGIVKIRELTDRLQRLEQKYNQHTHLVAGSGLAAPSGAVTGSANASATTNTSSEFQSGYSDFEDKKIKH